MYDLYALLYIKCQAQKCNRDMLFGFATNPWIIETHVNTVFWLLVLDSSVALFWFVLFSLLPDPGHPFLGLWAHAMIQ